ncbi:biotin-dependent carboxyltransferase family protein [Arthrobacter sp. ZGTC131]|uniref:5-oxoprolinase subunit C family protein n=1 Tax=Arthrobacter sp. ZGTC131 TaxID=2058898 RepID=UPI000CE4AB65|nr:biotin-dependent carboxyltransferase family protein [Arthrobacter sp. ZGTC131]
MGIVVLDPGPLTLIEDLGRRGSADLGLSPSGALDRKSLMLANALLGNLPGAPGLEVLLGGLRLRFVTGANVAVTGAEGRVTLNGAEIDLNQPVRVPPGAVMAFGPPAFGIRYYLAVSGGIAAPALLGSCSADLLSGEGPPPLKAGDTLALMHGNGAAAVTDSAPAPPPEVFRGVFRRAPDPNSPIALRVDRGPRADWFDDASLRRLTGQSWTISPDSNRIGARLLGRPLRLNRTEELPSEGAVLGALQVPPSGLPTVFLADHPVTGGYPVIAVVRRADVDLLGQARPGQRIRFLGAIGA